MNAPPPLRILFRGEAELVVDKPAGSSSERHAEGVRERIAASEGWPEARLPHRLDRMTRGALLTARDAASCAFHSESIRAGSWTKGYLARVAAPPDAGALLGPHRRYLRREGRKTRVVRSGGDPARLEVLAVAPAPGRPKELHLAIRLWTGRYHQVRAMCAALGAPLVGDALYGGPPGPSWLEHAAFGFPLPDGRRVGLFAPRDPQREAVDDSVLTALAAILEEDPSAGNMSAST